MSNMRVGSLVQRKPHSLERSTPYRWVEKPAYGWTIWVGKAGRNALQRLTFMMSSFSHGTK